MLLEIEEAVVEQIKNLSDDPLSSLVGFIYS